MEKNLSTVSKRIRLLSIFLSAAIATVFPAMFFMQTPPLNDGGTFTAIAQFMHHGAVLYKDVWDNKAPGIFFLHYLVQYVAEPVKAALILKVLFIFLCHVAGFLLMAHSLRRLLLLCLLTPIFWNIAFASTSFYSGDYTEFYGVVFLLISIALLASTQTRAWHFACSGIALSAAILIKEPFVFPALATVVFVLVTQRSSMRNILFFSLGGIFLPLLFALYLCINGAWDSYGSYLSFAFGYSENSSFLDFRSFFLRLYQDILVKFPLFTAGIIIALFSCLDREGLKQSRNLPIVLCAMSALSLFFAVLGKQAYDHYLLPFMICTLWFVFMGFEWLIWRLPQTIQNKKATVLYRILLLSYLMFQCYRPWMLSFKHFYGQKYTLRITGAAERKQFQQKIADTESLYVEHEGIGRFYSYSKVHTLWKYPCPYVVFFGTEIPSESESKRRQELVQQFTQHPPDVVVSRMHYGPAFAYAKLWDYIYAHYENQDSMMSSEGEALAIWRKKRSTH